ncbi:MAG: alanine racemase [Candidatus Dojkabacteria bacterium]|nr:alanine racemase [Candidatus Dojkabacteria bacterium]
MKIHNVFISKDALLHNFHLFKSYVHHSTKIACVVKADAYGHGIENIVPILDPHADMFQVDDVNELIKIRKYTSKKVLVLGFVSVEDIEEIVKNNGTLGIFSKEQIIALEQILEKHDNSINVHLAVDSLMGREGFVFESIELDEILDIIAHSKFIKLEGVYSHFSNADDLTLHPEHTQKQVNLYEKFLEKIRKYGFKHITRHISSTSGTIIYDKNFGKNDIVRIGAGLYGIYPSEDIKSFLHQKNLYLKPVLSWKTFIAQIKTVPPRTPIGYNMTYTTNRFTKIAVIPVGYSDGYDRRLSNKGYVLIHGKKAPVIGRISMNMLTVDITDIHSPTPSIEDEVVLIGEQENQKITASELANLCGTIEYEILSRIKR